MRKAFLFMRGILYLPALAVFPCRIMHKEKYKKTSERGRMVVANHLAWFDLPYQIFFLPGYKRMLSKKENANDGFSYWFLRKMGVILINREKPELSAMRECISTLKAGETLIVYPEGTRNRVNRELQPFHSGAAMMAFKGNATITPIAVHHKGKAFRMNYMGIGDPISIDDLDGRKMDEALLDEITERFRVGIQKTLDELDEWVANKGWKADRKNRRLEKKRLKQQEKQAKKEAAAAKKAEKR